MIKITEIPATSSFLSKIPGEKVAYKLYYDEETCQKALKENLHSGIFTAAAIRILNKAEKKQNTYYLRDLSIFMDTTLDKGKILFTNLRKINVFENQCITTLDEPITPIKELHFLKSYDDGRRIYYNSELLVKMKKLGVAPHQIPFRDVKVGDGQYRMCENGLVIEFHRQGDYVTMTNIDVPDIGSFGVAVIKR